MKKIRRGCRRSHPHEEMDAECVFKTELARKMNQHHEIGLSIEDVRGLLRMACAAAGSQYQWATKHKISPPYVSDVLGGRIDPGHSLLEAIGLKKIVAYVYASLLLATILLAVPTWSYAAEVTLDFSELKGMVSQCHSCRKAVAAYKEKDQAQAAVIDSQKSYIETLEEGQRIQVQLNEAYETKLKEGEQLSWYERGAWLVAGATVALVTKRYAPIGGLKWK